MNNKDLILVVDDNINNLRVVGNILNENGYKIALAKNGPDALKLLNDYKPLLILLDIMMPKMDGYEVCEKLKKNEQLKDIPVIFLTARNNPEDIVNGFLKGGVDYITKPFNREELLARVQNHIELFKARITITKQANELKIANDAKNKVFSLISHDMRIPLATLQLVLDKLLKTDFTEKKEFVMNGLKLMQVSANQTHLLFENLLNWSRDQLGKLKCVKANFNLVSIILKNIQLLHNTMAQKNIEINFCEKNEVIVFADSDMINTVIRNLLANAIKYSFKNDKITVSIEKLNNEIITHISDNGTGMSADFISNLFNDQLHESKNGTDGEKGTGLGLSICKTFIEMNNGKIWAYNNPNKGSTFCFSLPIKKGN